MFMTACLGSLELPRFVRSIVSSLFSQSLLFCFCFCCLPSLGTAFFCSVFLFLIREIG